MQGRAEATRPPGIDPQQIILSQGFLFLQHKSVNLLKPTIDGNFTAQKKKKYYFRYTVEKGEGGGPGGVKNLKLLINVHNLVVPSPPPLD